MSCSALARSALVVVSLCLLSTNSSAFTIGAPADTGTGNCFPFGCVGVAGNPSTRYQQVYSAGEFEAGASLPIASIQFFQTQLPGGAVNQGLYTIRLSTTSAAVNELDTVDFDSNLGADVAVFAQDVQLADAQVASGLSFGGSVFNYDPLAGNLLIDIQIAGVGHFGPNAFFDSRNGTADEVFSRAHNFNGFFLDTGLVTGFTPVPEPATAAMLVLGLAALAARRRRGRTA